MEMDQDIFHKILGRRDMNKAIHETSWDGRRSNTMHGVIPPG